MVMRRRRSRLRESARVEVSELVCTYVGTCSAGHSSVVDALETEAAVTGAASPEGADPAKHSDFSTNSPDPVKRRRRRRHSTKAMEMAGAEDLVEAPLEVPRRRRRRGSSGEPALAEAEAPQAPKVQFH